MSISIIISGNLTGFSRFFTSPDANSLYNDAKFDFDYRNLVTFMRDKDEKIYALSFSPKVIAVSLVTRILDSFRRPGILVVSVLLSRHQLVSDTPDAGGKTAIYRLLNEVNDKFYEKNFLNGMLNQNPAVLMQDYYSDILGRYNLVSDRMQRPVNSKIEVAAPNKRIGYVAASEQDMPKYLSSLMRKSYEGYHHVFFASNAPQNIDEPAEEIVTYRVRVENRNVHIPGEVRLTDRIVNVSPGLGERDLPNKNFTYGEVLNSAAAPGITGAMENGDCIVMSFRFPKEEKTIHFKFFDGTNELPIHVIRPILEDSKGTSIPISSDSFTFYGEEIYGRKTIKGGNPDYSVDSIDSTVDLQRYNTGATISVHVSKGWEWSFNPLDSRTGRPATIHPVDIVLENRLTHECRSFPNVTGSVSRHMPGEEKDWQMRITSKYYESVTCAPNEKGFSFRSKPQPEPKSGEEITDDDSDIKEIRKRLIQYGLFALAMIMCGIGGWWGYTKIVPSTTEKQTQQEPSATQGKSEVKNVEFIILDSTGDIITEKTRKKLTIKFDPDIKPEGKSYAVWYDPKADSPHKIKVSVVYQGIELVKPEQNAIIVRSMGKTENIHLSVRESDITLYSRLEKGIKHEDYDDYSDKVENVRERNVAYYTLLKVLLEKNHNSSETSTPGKKDAKDASATSAAPTPKDKIRKELDDLKISLNDLQGMKGNNKAEKDRIRALSIVLGSISTGKCPHSSEGLSNTQKGVVKQLIALQGKIDKLPAATEEQKNYKKKKQKEFSDALKGKNSIHSAREALKVKV